MQRIDVKTPKHALNRVMSASGVSPPATERIPLAESSGPSIDEGGPFQIMLQEQPEKNYLQSYVATSPQGTAMLV